MLCHCKEEGQLSVQVEQECSALHTIEGKDPAWEQASNRVSRAAAQVVR